MSDMGDAKACECLTQDKLRGHLCVLTGQSAQAECFRNASVAMAGARQSCTPRLALRYFLGSRAMLAQMGQGERQAVIKAAQVVRKRVEAGVLGLGPRGADNGNQAAWEALAAARHDLVDFYRRAAEELLGMKTALEHLHGVIGSLGQVLAQRSAARTQADAKVGLKGRWTPWTTGEVAEAARMHQEGLTRAEIGRRLGRTPRQVAYRLRLVQAAKAE
jgi:hypothetical protein